MLSAFRHSIIFLFALLISCAAFSQKNAKADLTDQIQQRIKGFDGQVGVGVAGIDFNEIFLINNATHFPMQSVYKLPLAIYILHRVELDAIRLNQVVHIQRSKLDPETWSPMFQDSTKENFDLTVAELLRYSVSKSDNNACDLLFELAGGTKPVHEYFQSKGVSNMAIAATEAKMHADRNSQYSNWCQPTGMLEVLRNLYKGVWLNASNTELLLRLMTESENSPNRIKGKLPQGTIVAHKTGTGFSEKGTTSATNDVGIVTLPNGKHYAFVVFVSNYKGDVPMGEALIADISKMAWDYFTRQTNETPKPRLIDLFDSGRHRHIPVAVYEPLKAPKKQREIVILNHGYAPESTTAYLGYSYLANLFVSLGYTVISIQQDQPEDPPMPTEGNPRVVRRPFWETGVQNIDFVIAHLPELTTNGRYDEFILVGHSMGGDIAALYATKYPERLTALITLDNRRMPLPQTKFLRVLSLRSADQPADEGVLPTEAEAKTLNMEIIKLSHTNHSDMDDHGTEEQKKEICKYIEGFLL